MQLLSKDSICATFLKQLGMTYKEIADVYDIAPNTAKYHIYMVKKNYPDIEEYFFSNVLEVPESKEDKIRLAKELTEKFIQSKKQAAQENLNQPQESMKSTYPTLLLSAIDKSVSTYYERVETKEFEDQVEEEHKSQSKIIDKNTYILIAIFSVGIITVIIILLSKKKEENSPSHPIMTPPTMPLYKRPSMVKLSQLGM